jgi:hypothetical protein
MQTDAKATGRKRHRIAHVGWLWSKKLMVLQHEFTGLTTTWASGDIEVSDATWWVDAKPEWETVHG